MSQLSSRKILVAELAESNRFCIASEEYFYGDTVCGITLREDVDEDLRFVLGVLNSSLIEYLFKKTTVPKANGFFIYKTMFLKRLPVIRIDFSVQKEKAAHDELVAHVDTAMDIARTGRSTKAVEAEIDRNVYELYGLSENDISMIESAARGQDV